MNLDLEQELPRNSNCATVARGVVDARLPDWVDEGRRTNILLATSELVTNAYRHGGGKIVLKIAFADEHVVVEVVDQGNADWIRVNTNPRKVGGWGLQIVEAVSAEWGVFEGTTHVWAKLPLS